jgi:hypothetical protein
VIENDNYLSTFIYDLIGTKKYKDKWVFQTFWTKPMDKDKIETNIKLAYISLYYLHKNGYKVRMYTDRYGL